MVAIATEFASPRKGCSPKTPIGDQVQLPGLRYYNPELGRWVSRDPIEDGNGSPVLRTFSFVPNVAPNLYLFANNRPRDRVDFLGLLTITKEAGDAAFEGARETLKAMCDEPCCKCKDAKKDIWDPCKPEDCEAEVDKIIDGIKATWRNNFGKGGNTGPDAVGGYLCWDWAAAFVGSVHKKQLKCWSHKKVAVDYNDGSDVVHYFLALYACRDMSKSECQVLVDDGWWGFVFKPPYPIGDGWKEINPPKIPPGKRLTKPIIISE